MGKDLMSTFRFNKHPPDRNTFSYKVRAEMKRDGRTYTWLAKQLNISRVALNDKIEGNSWTLKEINFLKQLLNIG